MVEEATHHQIAVELSFAARDGGVLEAAYFRLRPGEVSRTQEVVEGVLLADLDAEGNVIGIELLGPIRMDDLQHILPEPDKRNRVWHLLSERAGEFAHAA